MTPPLSAVLARLMGRQPTLGELEEVRRSAVRDAMVSVMGEPGMTQVCTDNDPRVVWSIEPVQEPADG